MTDPVTEILTRCREHHGPERLAVLERALRYRRGLGSDTGADPGGERALRRTLTLAGLRLDPPTLIASVLAGYIWDHYGSSATFFTGAAFTTAALVGLLIFQAMKRRSLALQEAGNGASN